MTELQVSMVLLQRKPNYIELCYFHVSYDTVAEVSTTSFFVNNILLYVNNVYLHSRAAREERGEKRGEERGTGPPPPRTRKLYKRVALAVSS